RSRRLGSKRRTKASSNEGPRPCCPSGFSTQASIREWVSSSRSLPDTPNRSAGPVRHRPAPTASAACSVIAADSLGPVRDLACSGALLDVHPFGRQRREPLKRRRGGVGGGHGG